MRSGSRSLRGVVDRLARLARSAGLIGLAALALSGGGCNNSKTGADKFAGTWDYAGVITPNCGSGGPAIAPLDLTGANVVITATDQAHLSVALGTACTVKFDVDGFTASAEANQSCTFDLGGTLGQQSVTITKWTLTSTGADSITSDFAGAILICSASGAGTLTRLGDAGATD